MYLALSGTLSPEQRNRTAWQTAFWVALILIVFFLAGSAILAFFGISIHALRIAGGLVILNSGFGLLNGEFSNRRVSPAVAEEATQKDDISFTPMAMPMLAGPGSISLLIGLAADEGILYKERLIIIGAVLAMSLIIGLTLRFAPLLFRILGESGLKALSRIMGFLVMAIGSEILIRGLVSLVKILLN